MSGHLWKPTWDPEGVLSTIPAIATTLLGILSGLLITSSGPPGRKTAVLGLAGAGAIIVGLVWDISFPINKALWTSSYVMFSAGAAALFLALCYWVIDVKGWRSWTKPFVILGVNALALYALAALLASVLGSTSISLRDGHFISLSDLIYARVFAPLASPKSASLLYAIANLAVLFAILFWMYRRRIFLRA
jgi:predicted acyltransferase